MVMTRGPLARITGLTAALGTVLVTAAGCGSGGFTGIQDLPLPGGADVGDHPYRVTAQFANVLNLVPQAAVKVNDVAVGRVTRISLPRQGWTADVMMLVNGDVRLPANAVAQLEQSSLLGEKYVQLAAPASGTSAGRLAEGAVIPMSRTNRNPEVEEVLGALSLLLNGGGIGQLRTITVELNNALSGNEPQVRSMLSRVDTLVSNLDTHKKDITDALDGLNRLSATLNAHERQIDTALDDLSPGLTVLEQQRGALVTMLRSLNTLSDVAVDTIDKSKEDMVADLKALAPILRRLADAGQTLPQSLQVLLTYPFTDAVLDAVKGDYLNVYLSVTATPGTVVIPPLISGGPAPAGARQRRAALPLPPIGGGTTPSAGTPSSAPPSSGSSPPTSPSPSSPGGTSSPDRSPRPGGGD
ncbi:MCE family protein [Actinomadura sp. HBU206391]|uniref:MCE family protein n=1 Tax=Actinomadura sp. HBU206391 TaxID=2731692 RepID=UPI00164F5C48|nr:MCE family protein [Actinomadura sp. HBU206391]MBC6461605.1 MCE family protein [Actinomadura sp. HBU206391]